MICEMNDSHIDEICQIEKENFKSPWSKKSFEQELNNEKAYYFVAIKDDQVVGYGGV